jgi:hypothetical protein
VEGLDDFRRQPHPQGDPVWIVNSPGTRDGILDFQFLVWKDDDFWYSKIYEGRFWPDFVGRFYDIILLGGSYNNRRYGILKHP